MIVDKILLTHFFLSFNQTRAELRKMSKSRPGIALSQDQHREILMQLDANEIQRLYQEKFAELIKDMPQSMPQSPMPGHKSPTLSEPPLSDSKPFIATTGRSLTAPVVRLF